MTAGTQKTAIVLVNWNGWRDVVDCLDSVLASDALPLHLYVVDNDSSDGSVEKIIGWCRQPERVQEARELPGVRRYTDAGDSQPIAFRLVDKPGEAPALADACRVSIVRSGGNLGFAGGNNVGLRLALREACDWFWLLNTDTAIRHDALTRLLDRAQRDDGIGITGSTLVHYYDPEHVQALGGAMDEKNLTAVHLGAGLRLRDLPVDPAEIEARMTYVIGASMLVPRSFLERVGLMEEDYFLYYEELDWAMRAKGLFRLAWAPDSIVWHKVGNSSSRREAVSLFSLSLLYRNRIKFAARFLPQRLGVAKRSLWRLVLFYLSRGMLREARIVIAALLSANELIRQGQRS